MTSDVSPVAADSRPLDLVRQIVVISALVFAIIAAWVGVGGLGGTSVQGTQGGALDAGATFLTPARQAFQIWSVIYVGLAAYTIWQALPGQRASSRQRSVGWWIALTMVLNGLWIVAAQVLPLWATVVVIFLLLIALCITFQRTVTSRIRGDGVADAVLIDGVTGLHLGWVTLASVANVASWLTEVGPESWAAYGNTWGVAVLIAVALIGFGIAWGSGWRITPGLAIAWGLAWLAFARSVEEPRSTAIAVTAVIVAIIVGLVPLAVAGLRLLRPTTD